LSLSLLLHLQPLSTYLEASYTLAFNMADDIVIDKQLFHERLSSLVTKWKADKRSGDAVFQGAGSIAAVVGKPSEPGSYLKPAAFQVGAILYELGRRTLIIMATALVTRL
jgi:hypothetical protein